MAGVGHQAFYLISRSLRSGASIEARRQRRAQVDRDSSVRVRSDVGDVLGERFLHEGNRWRVCEADRDDGNAQRSHCRKHARVKLVNRIAREGCSFREGDDGASLFGAFADLSKRHSSASPIFTVHEDRIAMLRQSTEQRPTRDVVLAQHHALKEGEHHSDIEHALVIRHDQRPALVCVLPMH